MPYATAGHRLGPTNAVVTIVEFGDYQCRYCREAEAHIAAIRREFADDVTLVFRHFPLRLESASYTAARAAECAGEQGAFWPYHERLFESRDWQVGDTVEALRNLGVDVGIADPVQFEVCLGSQAPVAAITADLEAAAALGVIGTPASLVNGRLSLGVLDSLAFFDAYRDVRP
ncbi:DsbA family protein [Candidatus Palauibacter sp.]|uniref:DsbA family protein n=1 Tax=Candidatus Palauibacter sp. TaxID=3101350 RepID=UPI003CC5C629